MNIKVGCCGFPVSMKKYFENLKLVEVQKTFYDPPSLKTVKKWRENAPNDFEFSIKAWQVITHPPNSPTFKRMKRKNKITDCGFFKPIKEVFNAWDKTKEIADTLNAKVILFQTPKSFKDNKENMNNMREFFSSLEKKYIFVWEPRGWRLENVKTICQELNLIHCVDPFIEKPCYGNIAYLRLHGSHAKMYKHKYTDDELKWLMQFVKELGKSEIYVLFNNVYMYEDSLRFLNNLKEH